SDSALRLAPVPLHHLPAALWRDGRGSGTHNRQVHAAPSPAPSLAPPGSPPTHARPLPPAPGQRSAAATRIVPPTARQRRAPRATAARSHTRSPVGRSLPTGGTHLTVTDGGGSGRVRLLGTRDLATLPREPIQRVRLLCRADGSSAQ